MWVLEDGQWTWLLFAFYVGCFEPEADLVLSVRSFVELDDDDSGALDENEADSLQFLELNAGPCFVSTLSWPLQAMNLLTHFGCLSNVSSHAADITSEDGVCADENIV